MKIEVTSAKNLVLDTEESLGGIFAIHANETTEGYSDADHNALEIQAAIRKDMVPVLFLDDGMSITVCSLFMINTSSPILAYEFRGWNSSYGQIQVQIDINGKVFLPR